MTEGKQALLARVLREAGRPVDVPALLASLLASAVATADAAGSLEPGADAPPPRLVQYQVTYEYAEDVEGATRRFLHQPVVEAAGLPAARAAALAHFDQLGRESGVGWRRTLVRYHVAEVTTRGLPS